MKPTFTVVWSLSEAEPYDQRVDILRELDPRPPKKQPEPVRGDYDWLSENDRPCPAFKTFP
jgi:hypothetical protein